MASTASLSVVHNVLLRRGNPPISICAQIQINANDIELPHWSLDLILRPGEDHNGQFSTTLHVGSSESPPLVFLNECITSPALGTQQAIAIRFIFSKKGGQVARCDFLERRLECCEHVAKVASFLSPLQSVVSVNPNQVTPENLCDILSMAVGGIRVRNDDSKDPVTIFLRLDHELRNRLSFPWILPEDIPRKRVVWVQGREDILSSRRAYEAAWALGISLVVIDHAGHWLQNDDGPYSHLREAFIPLNIDVNDEFTQRIVHAVRGYSQKIDGLMTISDVRLPGVAKACEILGLPTSSSDAYAIAGDKAKTRMLEQGSDECFSLSSAEELEVYLSERRGRPIQFPMVVKPCIGWNSDCVSKVFNNADLAVAVRKAAERHSNSPKQCTAVVIEPYIDGPEVDANFVLLDGEILFFEICDDFPCKGDAEDASLEDNFQETQMVFPTSLPDWEISAIRESIHRSILRQGFSSGVFHCEARIQHSSTHYRLQNGILDLEEKTEKPSHEVNVYLLEINARPPGYPGSVAVQLCYGVDYYAVRLLQCMGSTEAARICALSQPFLNGPQFTLAMTVIPQTKTGVMKTADVGAEFLERYDWLRDQIPDYKTSKKGGDIIEDSSSNELWWIAYFSVFSRLGRKDCLKLSQFIRQNVSYDVEDI
ncbi:hypothetical protein V491_08259 [Pseudogymnoascus sp. VKM F-3775]|nr:hypothetical protein V491_08259 [Pseudogymnoascus sp. VKM F-3775]